MTELLLDRVESGIGTLLLVCNGTRLCALGFGDDDYATLHSVRARYGSVSFRAHRRSGGDHLADTRVILRRVRRARRDCRRRPAARRFQREVWAALREIPPARRSATASSRGRSAGRAATRAVGLTNGLNPSPSSCPVNRVIGADASLTGYGGGLHRKRWLLEHEGLRVHDGVKVGTLRSAGLRRPGRNRLVPHSSCVSVPPRRGVSS